MKRNLARWAASSAAAAICLSALPAGASPAYTTFDPPNSIQTVPQSINDAGVIAGYYEDSTHAFHGFVRAADGTITSFDPPGAIYTGASSINSAGVIVGSFEYGQGGEQHEGFIRTPDGTITAFSAEKSADRTYANAINKEGAIVGTWTPHNVACCGFIRAADGKTQSIKVIHQSRTIAVSINDAGTVAGYYTMGDQAAGFLRSPDGSIATFQVSGAQATYPNSINNTDTVAGSYFEGNHYQSFLRTSDGTITELDPFGADGSQASAIDKRGSIVGTYYFARDTYDQGYLRTDGGKFVKVNFPKSVGTAPQSINDMDVIAGFYVDAARVAHGFVRSP